MGSIRAAKIILRWGLAFVFFYAAISSLRHPADWVGYLPYFLGQTIDHHPLLTTFSVFEIVLAAWLFSGRELVWSAGLAALALAGVILSNIGAMDILFRDVGLVFAALALLELARTKNQSSEPGE